MELIIGDAVLSNPFQWTVATINLKFSESSSIGRADKNALYEDESDIYTTKPEIKVQLVFYSQLILEQFHT